MAQKESEISAGEPLVSYRVMFDAEVKQAVAELSRPSGALVFSGIIAGISVGTSVMLAGAIASHAGDDLSELFIRLLYGNAYAIGFILAILGRTDLFTGYTTIAVFPVLTGDSRTIDLARLWSLIYAGNLLGGLVVAALVTIAGPPLGFLDIAAFTGWAHEQVAPQWWVVLVSAVLAGWLMGLLSWLIAGGRDTTSQFLFIWLIGLTIGVLGLHHVITGGIALMAAAMVDTEVVWSGIAHFFVWTTLGNAVGGIAFAFLVRQGVRMQPQETELSDREEGREERRRGG